MTTPKAPVFRTHTFKQECQIVDRDFGTTQQVAIGYEFNGGKRKFQDKVDKKKSYDD